MPRWSDAVAFILVALVWLAALAVGVSGPAVAASALEAFAGSWSGGGAIAMTDGARERIRCKANYAPQPGGRAMRISIDCASDSYKVQVISDVVASPEGGISGSWQESTREVSGEVTGRLSAPGELQARLGGTPYDIQLYVSTRGRQQLITMRLDNTDVQSVTIDLRRAS